MNSITEICKPFIWAHRGASKITPENTMAAFIAAADSGADGIEMDIHLSRDGVPVVIHDETLERTTDGFGRVAAADWQELKQLDAGSWFSDDYCGEPVPSLAEVLGRLSGQIRLNLELKDFSAGKAVLELLADYPGADVVISSFDHRLLSLLRQEYSHLPIGVLYDKGRWHKVVAFAQELRAVSFNPRADMVTRPMIAKCHDTGLTVYPWTVDSSCHIRALLRAGVDGLFTNDPQGALSSPLVISGQAG